MSEPQITQSVEHKDDTPELGFEIIKTRVVKSIALLTGRTFILQIISLGATFLLTIFLNPAEFGTFFIVSAVISFLTYFSDIGLAAALIQKKESLTQKELQTTFTIQQCLVISLVLLVFVLTSFIQNWYHLNSGSVYLLWALAISLFLSSLKSIPSVLLERRLDFNKLVLPQIAEALVYNFVAVILAWKGFGVASFAWAVLLRGLVGLFLIYWLQPWKPGFAFDQVTLKGLLRYGLPYQLNTFLAVAKDDGMTVVLGSILGVSNIGLLGWAQKWASAPLRFFMDQVIKVTFPAFARLQHDKDQLSQTVSRSLFFISLLVFPSIVGLITLAPILVQIIPKYQKWQPALLALSLISINTAWAAISTPLTNLLNAIGKITLTFKLMVMWTVLTWLLLPILSLEYGVNGAAWGYALVGFSSIVAIKVASKYATINFIEVVGKPLLAAFLMSIAIVTLSRILPQDFWSVLILAIVGLVVYLLVLRLLIGQVFITDLKNIFNLIRSKERKTAL